MRARAFVSACVIAISPVLLLSQSSKRRDLSEVTGLYTQTFFSEGNYFGHTILIYRVIDHWAIYQRVDEQEMQPLAALVTVHGKSVEFSIELSGGQKSTFKGIVKHGYLVGKFDTSGEVLKLKKMPL